MKETPTPWQAEDNDDDKANIDESDQHTINKVISVYDACKIVEQFLKGDELEKVKKELLTAAANQPDTKDYSSEELHKGRTRGDFKQASRQYSVKQNLI